MSTFVMVESKLFLYKGWWEMWPWNV